MSNTEIFSNWVAFKILLSDMQNALSPPPPFMEVLSSLPPAMSHVAGLARPRPVLGLSRSSSAKIRLRL